MDRTRETLETLDTSVEPAMQLSVHSRTPAQPRSPLRYADRITTQRDEAGHCNVSIDGTLRFRIEGDGQWPAQWRLFRVMDGVREIKHIALENEFWDVLEQLERGMHWQSSDAVERAEARAPREPSYHRWPLSRPE